MRGESDREPRDRQEQPLDDVLLIERVADGDRTAFRELYRTYYPRLFGYVLRMIGRPEVVEEVLDDVLMVVWRKAHRFERRSRVSTWIFGIAYRQTLRALRARGRSPRFEELDSESVLAPDSPERDAHRRQRAERLERALRALSPEQRAVVELTYFEGLSYPEIARIAGCPVGTVKSRMFHARRKLRRLVAELENDETPDSR